MFFALSFLLALVVSDAGAVRIPVLAQPAPGSSGAARHAGKTLPPLTEDVWVPNFTYSTLKGNLSIVNGNAALNIYGASLIEAGQAGDDSTLLLFTEGGPCRQQDTHIVGTLDLDWLPDAVYQGQDANGDGVTVDMWSYAPPNGYCNITVIPMSKCTVSLSTDPSSNQPLQLNVTGIESGVRTTAYMEFTGWMQGAGVVPANAFSPPGSCANSEPPMLCDKGPVEDLTVYKNIPKGEGLENENGADATGEAVWLCAHGHSPNEAQVTQFTMSVNTTWGLYAQCNLRHCATGYPKYVDTYGFTPVGRQCPGCNQRSDDPSFSGQCDDIVPEIGRWFSWESAGECTGGVPVGTNGCSWTTAVPVKTITVECANKNDRLLNACPVKPSYDYRPAGKVLEQAFTDCPAV